MNTNQELEIEESLYFYLTGNWYKGKMPNFYNVENFESTRILEDNFNIIQTEILDYYQKNKMVFKANFTPYKYREEGWKTVNLMGFLLKYDSHIKRFPKLFEVVAKIPDLLTVQIAVLKPGTRVKAHFGDTNAIIRNHLGVVVPGKLPDIGFRNGSREKCWEEGKVLAICVAHRHYVWNYTDKTRIILLVDTIHPKFKHKKYYICAGLLAASLMKLFSNRITITKKFPDFLIKGIHHVFTSVFWLLLKVQDVFKLSVSSLWNRHKLEV